MKDEPTADIEEPEELAGADTASTALVKFSGNDHFSDSTCRDSYCKEAATGESPYCRLRGSRPSLFRVDISVAWLTTSFDRAR